MKILISFILYLVFFPSVWATEEFTPKELEDASLKLFPKFKIGVELQESSHLCPWHGERSEFQNKEIFSVSVKGEKGRKLWSLVIDTDDIEFVTSPFPSDKEEEVRNLCMQSIEESITILKKILKSENDAKILKIEDLRDDEEKIRKEIKINQDQILNLENKRAELRRKINENYEEKVHINLLNEACKILQDIASQEAKEFLQKNSEIIDEKKKNIKRLKYEEKKVASDSSSLDEEIEKLRESLSVLSDQELKNSQQKSEVTQKINVTFSDWIKDMENSLLNLKLEHSPTFDLVKGKPLVLSKLYKEQEAFWEPRFSPQVTLQHPLSVAIPLYFYLFAGKFEEHKMTSAIPCYNTYSRNLSSKQIPRELCTSLNGLIFIHALTLSQTFGTAIKTDSDSEALDFIFRGYERFKQIDVKMWLLLMSRRAFSNMFEDIKSNQDFSYIEQFNKRIFSGNKFFNSEIKEKSKFINYGQQFFEKSGETKDLRFLIDIIKKEFYIENKEKIEDLLKIGIITTAMIRNFNDKISINGKQLNSLFDSYFEKSIDSVQNPAERIGYGIEFHHKGQFNFFDEQNEIYGIGYEYKNQVYFKKYTEFDTLSPPWFLARDDSMGNMSRSAKNDSNISDNENIEKDYGEAVIEIRDLKAISLRLLEAENLFTCPNSIKEHFDNLFTDIRKFQDFINGKSPNTEFLDLSFCINN